MFVIFQVSKQIKSGDGLLKHAEVADEFDDVAAAVDYDDTADDRLQIALYWGLL